MLAQFPNFSLFDWNINFVLLLHLFVQNFIFQEGNIVSIELQPRVSSVGDRVLGSDQPIAFREKKLLFICVILDLVDLNGFVFQAKLDSIDKPTVFELPKIFRLAPHAKVYKIIINDPTPNLPLARESPTLVIAHTGSISDAIFKFPNTPHNQAPIILFTFAMIVSVTHESFIM